jgi:hypothetical protein
VKVNVTTVLLVIVCGAIGYLAFDPDAGREVMNWVRRQVGNDVPDPKKLGHPNYTPVVPGK